MVHEISLKSYFKITPWITQIKLMIWWNNLIQYSVLWISEKSHISRPFIRNWKHLIKSYACKFPFYYHTICIWTFSHRLTLIFVPFPLILYKTFNLIWKIFVLISSHQYFISDIWLVYTSQTFIVEGKNQNENNDHDTRDKIICYTYDNFP